MQDESSSISRAATASSWGAKLARAAAQVGADGWGAVILVFVGWFVLDTLHLDWGPVRQGLHFYEIASAVRNPAHFLLGTEGTHGIATVPFALLCVVTLLAPITPYIWRNRLAWLAWLAPLALIIVVASWLYTSSNADLLREQGMVDTLGNDFRHLANHLVHRAGAGVARKVSFSAGGYVALLGSAYLAWRGIRNLRTRLPT